MRFLALAAATASLALSSLTALRSAASLALAISFALFSRSNCIQLRSICFHEVGVTMHVRVQLLPVHVTVALMAAGIAARWLVNLVVRAHHLTDIFARERPHIAHLRHANKIEIC